MVGWALVAVAFFVGSDVAVSSAVAVTRGAVVCVSRISVGVGGGTEGSGVIVVMALLADRKQAVSARLSRNAIPTGSQCSR
jgi:hypothetical protein